MKEGLSRPAAAQAAVQPKFGRRSPSKGRPNWGRQLGRPTLTNDEWMAHFDFGAPAAGHNSRSNPAVSEDTTSARGAVRGVRPRNSPHRRGAHSPGRRMLSPDLGSPTSGFMEATASSPVRPPCAPATPPRVLRWPRARSMLRGSVSSPNRTRGARIPASQRASGGRIRAGRRWPTSRWGCRTCTGRGGRASSPSPRWPSVACTGGCCARRSARSGRTSCRRSNRSRASSRPASPVRQL